MDDERSCPICRDLLVWIEDEGHFWCATCREDPFRESEIHDRECAIFMKCSVCSTRLRFIPRRGDFWCWKCNEYPAFRLPMPRKVPLGDDDDPYRRSEFICFKCGRYLRYIESKDDHWCDSCRKFPLLYYHSDQMSRYDGTDPGPDFTPEISSGKDLKVDIDHVDLDRGGSSGPSRNRYRIRGNELFPESGGPAHYRISGNSVISTSYAPEGPGRRMFRISGERLYRTSCSGSSRGISSYSLFR